MYFSVNTSYKNKMKKLVKTKENSELNSYYDMMRCSCGVCGGCPACACFGNNASSFYITGTPSDASRIEAGFREAPAY